VSEIAVELASGKKCPACKKIKSRDEFNKDVQKISGLHPHCRECVAVRAGKYYRENKAHILVCQRKRIFEKKYGISVADYDSMNSSQGGVCKICGGKNNAGRRLAVDHCHVTNKVRGLLCNACNQAIGLLKDSVENITKAADYVRMSGAI